MRTVVRKIALLISFILCVKCGYPPQGDEVTPGSVLLPASRRGRYLANIVRRQAVDGTGIKFNKDADRMNAEAKKKVDVLSEELLPYIIAEQERRTTLHKRVMTAIQNAEKGVTIAELRNKPPLIIRKGILYRCPSNRAPKEPDGSGVLSCEDEIEPSQVMYDSCLSAEDKQLYATDKSYFFCNRQRVQGPELPRNGSVVFGCHPSERTSLNYTMAKCALEDTDDVVVHYRYYPDRTYKFVTELDPDREVCDHWNPCQVGYIYSLQTPDMAVTASELYPEYREKNDEYERDEIVPPVPQDSIVEGVPPAAKEYTSSPRRVPYPSKSRRESDAYVFKAVEVRFNDGTRKRLTDKHMSHRDSADGKSVTISVFYNQWRSIYYGTYFVVFSKESSGRELSIKFLDLVPTSVFVSPQSIVCFHGQKLNSSSIPYKCNRCQVTGLMVRGSDGNVYNVDNSRWRSRVSNSRQGRSQQAIELEIKSPGIQDFGDFFMISITGDGVEERVKILTVRSPEMDNDDVVKLERFVASYDVGSHYDKTTNFTCDDCEMTDILCNGASVLAAGRVSIISQSKMVSFNFPRFEDEHACVYMGFFKVKDKVYRKILAVIDNASPAVQMSKPDEVVTPPPEGEQFEHQIDFTCEDCSVKDMFVNGLALQLMTRRNTMGSAAFYVTTGTSIDVRITEFGETYAGVYQAIFRTGEAEVTKTVLEISSQERKTSNVTEAPPDDKGETTIDSGSTNGEITTGSGGTEEPTTGAGPKDEAPAENGEPPANTVLKGEIPADKTSKGETPTEKGSNGETPAENGSTGETPADTEVTGETPADTEVTGETPTENGAEARLRGGK